MNELLDIIVSSKAKNIAIIGNGAGGKSFLAKNLIERFQYSKNQILDTDDYLLDSNIRKSAFFEKKTVYHAESYFLPALERDVVMAMEGKPFTKLPNYLGEMNLYLPKEIKIFEGIGLPFTKCFAEIDQKIFIYTDRKTELEMRLKRDVEDRDIPINKVLADFEIRREYFVNEYCKWESKCDLVVKNNQNSFEIVRRKFDVITTNSEGN